MRKNIMAKVFCALLLVISICRANGQAEITGVVTDFQSHPVSHVSVRLLNTRAATITNTSGRFTVGGLQPGKYTIELSAIGYAVIAKEIFVNQSETQVVNFQLQNALVQLETVVVTAGKKEELLQNLAVSVTAMSARQVKDYRLWNIKDLAGIVPNLYAGSPGDERNVTSIRGVTTTSYEPSVATYIDGVNQFSLDTYIPQLTDIERIEVLRGPQGTLYGRNAMGGVISIITKAPSNIANGFAEASFGNYNQQRYSVGLRFPFIKDKLFAGISSTYSKRNGFYENDFNHTSFDRQQQNGYSYYIKYLPGSKWTIALNGKYQLNKNKGAFPIVNGVDEALNHPYVLSQNALGKMMDETNNTSLSVSHKSRVADFTLQTAWQNNYRYYDSPIDGDFSTLDAVTVGNNYGSDWNNVKVFTTEFRISKPANKTTALSWTGGVYLFRQSIPNKQATHFGKDAAVVGAPNTDFSTINTSKGKNAGIAVYGQINYALTKSLSLIAGLRYDYEHKKLQVEGEYQPDGTNPIVILPDTAAAVHYNAVSPKLGLQYALTADNNIYITYSRGFRTGGLTQLSGDPSQPPLYPYSPEYSNNIELGAKNTFWDNRLRLNAALFLTYVNDAQVPTLVLPDAITVTKNTGKLESKGAELELSANPLAGFQAEYSFGYTDAKYKSLGLSSNGQSVNLDGKRQIFTPDITSMLALQYSYTLHVKNRIRLVARGEWFYFGSRYFDFANTIEQSSYHFLNVKAGVTSKWADVYCWMRNLTDKKYIEYAYDFGGIHLGNPRTFGVTVSTMF
ncbi:MAG: TonB-dependent receptor [Bacteroidota bacterium]